MRDLKLHRPLRGCVTIIVAMAILMSLTTFASAQYLSTPLLDFWQNGNCDNVQAQVQNANVIEADCISIPITFVGSTLCAYIAVPDPTGLYDFGIYNSVGTLVADWGATPLPYGGVICGRLAQGTIELTPGDYCIASTGDSTVARFGFCRGQQDFFETPTGPATTGGQLPSTVTFPSQNAPQPYVLYFALEK